MRVTRNLQGDEHGAVAVFVAIVAVLMFAGAAYAVDAGNAWQTRRHVVTGADAAALAAAAQYAVGEDGCSDAAPEYLAANVDDAELESCVVNGAGSDRGNVTVRGHATADFTFAGVVGIDDREISAATTAQWGRPTGIRGLRPFGLCLDADTALAAWLNLPDGPTGPSDPITIEYGKEQPDACGDAPGNWGILDFNGGSNSNAEHKDWVLNGYPGLVSISPPTIEGDTGAFSNSTDSQLTTLKDSGGWFAIPIFDYVEDPGANAQFNIVAFVGVKLVDFKTTGDQAARYLTLEFDRVVLEGACCDEFGIDTGARVVRICDVDTLSPDPEAC